MVGKIFVVIRFTTPLGLHRRTRNQPWGHIIGQKCMGSPFCFLTVDGQYMSGT